METSALSMPVDQIVWKDSPSRNPALPLAGSYLQELCLAATALSSVIWVVAWIQAATLDGQWDGAGSILAATAMMALSVLGLLFSSVRALLLQRRHAARLLVVAFVVVMAAMSLVETIPPLVREGPCRDWHGYEQPC